MTNAAMAVLVAELKAEGRIVQGMSDAATGALVAGLKAEGRIISGDARREAERATFRAVPGSLVEINSRIPDPWPRPLLGKMAEALQRRERRTEKARLVARWHERRAALRRAS